jgi:hypothetical protein
MTSKTDFSADGRTGGAITIYQGFRIVRVGHAYRIRRLFSDLDCTQFGSISFPTIDDSKDAIASKGATPNA